MRGRKGDSGSQGRVSAADVEQLVVETLSRQLSRPKLSTSLAAWSVFS